MIRKPGTVLRATRHYTVFAEEFVLKQYRPFCYTNRITNTLKYLQRGHGNRALLATGFSHPTGKNLLNDTDHEAASASTDRECGLKPLALIFEAAVDVEEDLAK
jgi:hypothetical protein